MFWRRNTHCRSHTRSQGPECVGERGTDERRGPGPWFARVARAQVVRLSARGPETGGAVPLVPDCGCGG